MFNILKRLMFLAEDAGNGSGGGDVAAETEDVGAKARIPKMAINAAVTIFIKLIFMILLRY